MMGIPMKSHLSPASTISTSSSRNITSRLRGRREEREREVGKGVGEEGLGRKCKERKD